MTLGPLTRSLRKRPRALLAISDPRSFADGACRGEPLGVVHEEGLRAAAWYGTCRTLWHRVRPCLPRARRARKDTVSSARGEIAPDVSTRTSDTLDVLL